MTTIAFRDGIMASDSCVSGGGYYAASMAKVHRTSTGALIGWCGDTDNRAILALLDKVKTPQQLPSKKEIADCITDFAILMAFNPNSVWVIACNEVETGRYQGFVNVMNLGFAALGSGEHLALGAMLAGKSAREAVAIACKIDNASKLPVHSVSFEPKKPRSKPRPK